MTKAERLAELRNERAALTERISKMDDQLMEEWRSQDNPFKAWAWWVSPSTRARRLSLVTRWKEVGDQIIELSENQEATRRRMGVRRKEFA